MQIAGLQLHGMKIIHLENKSKKHYYSFFSTQTVCLLYLLLVVIQAKVELRMQVFLDSQWWEGQGFL